MAKKLYVGNLSFETKEDELTDFFKQCGEVHSVKIITDRNTGRSRGFCFVEMENADEAISTLNGKELGGRALTVNEAREKSQGGGGRDSNPRRGG